MQPYPGRRLVDLPKEAALGSRELSVQAMLCKAYGLCSKECL